MKFKNKIFIFGHCRNMLCRLLPLALKTFKFLACTDCTDSGESRKPCKASYSTRQAGNVYESFENLIKPHIESVARPIILKKRQLPDKGLVSCALRLGAISTTNKTEFPLTCILRDRRETINDRLPKLKDNIKPQTLSMGGEGLRLVFVSLCSSISFSLAI